MSDIEDKHRLLQLISKQSDRYGNLLVEMMDKYNKSSLAEMRYEEVKEFYEHLEAKDEK